ncbi:uncharacterized protein LOC131893299 isoform X2 [Tigriopus californicus]|uniref:uncharacterized protein LOC131893299 isoform X2 n=1 Tax=Tigriopus californicus TaxID=6832 RepID=UPI0027DAA972|nr:uncharacterized protein LOC131893299 isoform X2 [Tigriopus californicus]
MTQWSFTFSSISSHCGQANGEIQEYTLRRLPLILLKNNTSLTNPTSTTNESIWQCDGCAPNASIPRLNPNGTSTIGEWNCTDSSCQLATPVPGSGLVDGGNCSDDGCNTTRPDSCIPDFDCEFYRHSQYEGLPWKSLANITTPRICQAQCQSHLQFCLSWTLDSSSTCWLFDVIGSLKPLTNSVSGPVSLGCLIPGLEYLGANLATKQNVQRAEDCWKICRGNPRCTHFSMTPSRRSCALKETGVYLRASHYVISGPRDCPN